MKSHLKILIVLTICALIVVSLLFSWWISFVVGLLILGTIGYVEKIFNIEIPNKIRILLLCLFIFLSVGNLIYSNFKERSLNWKLQQTKEVGEFSKGQITDLAEKERDLRQQLQKAENSTTLAKAQISDLIENNRILQQQLKEAQDNATSARNEINDLAEYGEVSTYTFHGYQESGLMLSPFTPASKWTDGYLTISNNIYLFKCTPDAIEHYKVLINKCPKFPFPYLALAGCLLNNEDPSWRQYAIKAQSIMKKTTKIPLHCKAHDGWLEQVNRLLDPNQMKSVFVKGGLQKSE